MTLRGIVIHHHDHGDLVNRAATAGRPVWIAVIAAFEGKVIAVGPAALLDAASEVVMNFEDVRNSRIRKLSEILCVGVSGEGATGFTEGFGFVVAV